MPAHSPDSPLFERLQPILVGLLIATLTSSAVYFVRAQGWLFTVEARLADTITRQSPRGNPLQSPVVVVAISERDIRAWQQYPISDRKMSELLEKLLEARPRAIGIDVYRDVVTPDVRESPAREDRNRFIEIFRNNPILSTIYLNAAGEARVNPPPELAGTRAANRAVLSTVARDPDGIARRVPLFGFDDVTGRNEPTLSLAVAARYLLADNIRLRPDESDPDTLTLGKARIGRFDRRHAFYGGRFEIESPTDLQLVLDCAGPAQFERFDVEQVLNDPSLLPRFADRIVLIGVIAKSNKDIVPSPLSEDMPGVELHAHAADQLIRTARDGAASRASMTAGGQHVYMLMAAVVASLVAVAVRWQLGSVLLLAVLLGLMVGTGWLAFQRSYFVPIVPPVIAAAVSGGLTTAYVAFNQRRQRRVIMGLLGKTVSPAVADELWRQRRQLISAGSMRPREMVATVLFFDLKGFTSIAETCDPATMISLLNELFQDMATTIERHGGVVNKYIGDQILALFGPPRLRVTEEEQQQDARSAVTCAVELRRNLVAINQRWSSLGRPTIAMRVGIHTGPLVAGSVGSRDRLEYTVIGDTVNTASRLESAAKELFNEEIAPGGCRILIGGPTRMAVDGLFRIRPVEIGELKGKSRQVDVFAVLDH